MTEFKSQICTTVEQSKRLLGLGLRTETADMAWRWQHALKGKGVYEMDTDVPTHERRLLWIKCASLRQEFLSHWTNPDGTPMTAEEVYDEVWGKDLPAWSLHRLVELIWGDGEHDMSLETHRPFEDCIERIDYMINQIHCFNKEYLV